MYARTHTRARARTRAHTCRPVKLGDASANVYVCVCVAPLCLTHIHIRTKEKERGRWRENQTGATKGFGHAHTQRGLAHVRAAPKDNPHEYRARIIPVQGRVYGPLSVPYACTRTRSLIRAPWMMVRTKGRSRGCQGGRRRREDYGRAHKV